ncbi:MAG TPA: imidazole glycerol phosphate synthase subunit HisH [Candidatus Ornithospirochaeta avicola]|uniref:Imidazole glycerol phosphate synthase subunit HisH n=1 Tax=Candidatus Ornithospirochaeta avicola TaxID=2840896 RepID=A0A9D1PSJ7_9SPIO|nr:imidazole glycerol phosphate synthase subunit HisH [Candidatus Ornithospirochaeta avicola]
MKTVIINYNAGNVFSVTSALKRMGYDFILSDRDDEILSADRVIFPGVGEASSAMSFLRKKNLDEVIRQIKRPFLGICLGMQLMAEHSVEGDTECLSIFGDTTIRKFSPKSALKVPHMGWNDVYALKGELFHGIEEHCYFYFVHSYYASVSPLTAAECTYGIPFSAALNKDNFYGLQFHPEKSGEKGEEVLKNFMERT